MFDVIVDSREQVPWEFSSSAINEVLIDKLDSGDYSIAGYEKVFSIERKGSTSELFSNITQKRFENELERLVEYKRKFLIFEFSYNDILQYPYGSNIPKYKWKYLKVKPKFVVSKLAEFQIKYSIPIIYAGSRPNAIQIAESLMEKFYGYCQVE